MISGGAMAENFEVVTRTDIEFAEHDGIKLVGEEPAYSTEYRNDPNSSISHTVKAVVGVYGVYDMFRQWEHDQIARPRDQITEKFLGGSPMLIRRAYFDASPLSYVTVDK